MCFSWFLQFVSSFSPFSCIFFFQILFVYWIYFTFLKNYLVTHGWNHLPKLMESRGWPSNLVVTRRITKWSEKKWLMSSNMKSRWARSTQIHHDSIIRWVVPSWFCHMDRWAHPWCYYMGRCLGGPNVILSLDRWDHMIPSSGGWTLMASWFHHCSST